MHKTEQVIDGLVHSFELTFKYKNHDIMYNNDALRFFEISSYPDLGCLMKIEYYF